MGSIISSLWDTISFKQKPLRILMFGLDDAGKTTILYKLKLNKVVSTMPTMGFCVETIVSANNNLLTIWDVGFKQRVRSIWRHFLEIMPQGLIFVVDSNDRDRIDDAEETLRGMLEAEELKDVVLLIFANKQDLPNAMTTTELTDRLKLNSLRHHTWYIQATSAIESHGLYEGLDWLSNELLKK